MSGHVRLCAALACWLLCGCNQIFGVDKPRLRAPYDAGAIAIDSGTGPGTDAGADARASGTCLLPSDCQSDETCLFEHCSAPCAEDRDCPDTASCLKTADGKAACVRNVDNHCGQELSCPEGTRCSNGTCSSSCTETAGCLAGRSCEDGLCVTGPAADGGVDAGGTATSMEHHEETMPEKTPEPEGCTLGALRCASRSVERCDDGKSYRLIESCAFTCQAGACIGTCPPGERSCDGKARQACGDDGEFHTLETCSGTCTPDACVATCNDGVLQCSGRELQHCQDSAWLHDQDCPFVCTGNACTGSCVPEDLRCSDNTAYTCDAAGNWSSPVSCPFACVGTGCGGECVPAQRRCSDRGSYQICGASGSYGAVNPCVNQACADGNCVGGCAPGSARCNGATIEICDDMGRYVTQQTCQNQACQNNACVGVCTPDSTQCDTSSSFQRCNSSGQWSTTPQSCNGAACSAGQCTGSCTPNSKRCKPNSHVDVQSCNTEGVWVDQTTCSNQACVAGSCLGMCTPGSRRCNGGGTQLCGDDGQWGATGACSNQACAAGSCTGVCAPGTTRCNAGGQVETCDDSGNWAGASACANQTCVNGGCTGECAAAAKRCASSGNSVESCGTGGNWMTFQVCSASSQICKNGSCASNDPFNVGYSNTSGWTSAKAAKNRLYLIGPFDAGVPADILSINIIGSANSGVLVDMFIYQDNAGVPGAFRARANSSITVISGGASNTVKPVGSQIPTGVKFWLGAVFSDDQMVPQASGASFPTSAYLISPFTYGGAPPDPFPSNTATKVINVAMPFYLTLREIPP